MQYCEYYYETVSNWKYTRGIEHYDDPDADHHSLYLRKNAYCQSPILTPEHGLLLVKSDYVGGISECGIKSYPVINDYIYNVPFDVNCDTPDSDSLYDDFFDEVPLMGWSPSVADTIEMKYFEIRRKVISPYFVDKNDIIIHEISHGRHTNLEVYWAKSLYRDRFIYYSSGFLVDPDTAKFLEIDKYEKWFNISELDLET